MKKAVILKVETRPEAPGIPNQNKALQLWAEKLFMDPVRVELNNKAKIGLILGYTLLIISVTLLIANSLRDKENSSIRELVLNSSEALKDEEFKTVKIDNAQLAYSNKILVEEIRSEVIKSLTEKENARNEMIRSKDEKIQILNQRIEKLLVQIDAKNYGENNTTKNLVYSSDNEDILRKEQDLIERSFKNNQKVQKESFVGLLDLSLPEDQKKLESFISKQQLELYKLQKAFEKERRDFRTKTFRVATTKTVEEYIKLLDE